ncbi:E3 ubiquitin-protein ligase XIAP-like [Cydia amplana]|uniref:E3 ubiquitin-protein ligase XIAP-like n=1 Tax=Cydia amplana TaxID=1869771 RepID=UPI002FE68A0D
MANVAFNKEANRIIAMPEQECRYPHYETLDSRLKSYKHWPPSLPTKPEELAEAGFFYTGTGDRTQCFFCGGGLPAHTLYNLESWSSNHASSEFVASESPKLCNGTQLKVMQLQRNLIEAQILTRCGAGEAVLIPRIPLIPSNFPFRFKCLQFPVSVCFAMFINKCRGR